MLEQEINDLVCESNPALRQYCAADVQDSRKEAGMNEQKVAILYERLSVGDEREGESNSITNSTFAHEK